MTRVILALLVVAVVAVGASSAAPDGSGPASSPAAGVRAQGATSIPGTAGKRVSPLHDPRGTHPGLNRVSVSEFAKARRLIDRVSTAPAGSMVGYDHRIPFGPAWTDDQDATWGHDGCPTREEILRRDMTSVVFRTHAYDPPHCVVATGTLADPYTGQAIAFSKAGNPMTVQIDHVIPLAYDWRQGASGWTRAKREQIANDPLNLMAVQGEANQRKSDSGPAQWLPPTAGQAGVGCAYAVRWAMVSRKYRLPVQPQDKTTMRDLCGG